MYSDWFLESINFFRKPVIMAKDERVENSGSKD
jgi:hypothetical protein